MSSSFEANDQNNLLDDLTEYELGSAPWQKALYEIISKIVESSLSMNIPLKLRAVISCDELSQTTAMKVLEVCVPVGRQTLLTKKFVQVVAQRVLIDLIRHYLAQRRTPANGFVEASPTSSLNLLNELQADEKTASQLAIGGELWSVIAPYLSEHEFELLQMRFVEEMSVKEMAAIYGVPVGTIASQISRLCESLGEQLKMNSYFQSRL